MAPERILITGSNGLLGQNLVSRLSSLAGYEILATGRQSASRFPADLCRYTTLDLAEPSQIERVVGDFRPNVILHSGAITHVDLCEMKRNPCWQVNAHAVEELVRWSETLEARLIFLSTDFVFDGQTGPYREEDPPGPVNFYGKSKLAAEEKIRSSRIRSWAVARTSLVYGTARDLGRSNIATWVVNSLAKGESIRVVTDQIRTPTYVKDLADGIERLVGGKTIGVFHLSGSESLSVHDFALQVADVFELDPSLIAAADGNNFRQPAPRPPNTALVIERARRELGYSPRSVRECLRDLRARLEKRSP